MLAEAVVEDLKYFYAVYGLAKEKGYIEDSSYDAFLKRCYGDYMKLPPVEKRVPHYSDVEFV